VTQTTRCESEFTHTSRTGAASHCPSPCGRLARRAIFRFTETPNQWLNSGHPVPTRGAVARRHERGMGCGGRESVGAQLMSQGGLNLVSDSQARKTNDVSAFAKASADWHLARRSLLAKTGRVRQNRVVLTPVAGAKSAVANSTRPGLRSRSIRR
jgi:hypothetical protein